MREYLFTMHCTMETWRRHAQIELFARRIYSPMAAIEILSPVFVSFRLGRLFALTLQTALDCVDYLSTKWFPNK